MPGKENTMALRALVAVFAALSLFMAAWHFGAADSAEVKDSLKTHIAAASLCDKEHDERMRELEADSAGTQVALENIAALLQEMKLELREIRTEMRKK